MKLVPFIFVLFISCKKEYSFEGERSVPQPVLSVPIYSGNILCVGSNLTHGTDSATSYPSQLSKLLPGCNVINAGIDGATPDYLTDLIPELPKSDGGIAVVWEIVEDVYYNTSPALFYVDNFRKYCAALEAVGWRVVVLTVIWRSVDPYTASGFTQSQYDAIISQINDTIVRSWPRVVDVGAVLDRYDPEYYQPDRFNLTVKGDSVVAGIVAETVKN